MTEATFTFRVNAALKNEFANAAKAHDRTGAQLLRDFMRDFVRQPQQTTHDAWFRHEVALALAEANDPATQWISNEDAARESASWRRRTLAGEGKR